MVQVMIKIAQKSSLSWCDAPEWHPDGTKPRRVADILRDNDRLGNEEEVKDYVDEKIELNIVNLVDKIQLLNL